MSYRPSTWRPRAAAVLATLLGMALVLALALAAPDRGPGPGAVSAPGQVPAAAPAGRPEAGPGPLPVHGPARPALAGHLRAAPERGPEQAAGAGPARGPVRAAADRSAVAVGFGPSAPTGAEEPGRGPACGPGGQGRGEGAGVLPRAGGPEHAQLAAGRYAPAQARPHDASRARVLVPGPDQRAPKPVELSVMRV
ncbi:hypothetical protein QEZ40_003923 [Streptomyces katrae]|uniref:Uncharacterized protein n=1 Tax=Streptomyces katrae TaxID=68223 RepID=A0ABT7GYL3_9ACTN|nr:hypothetical protein [Streptomyces katrae]MDK9498722.1 hypothetical protein [Streptomyces katrae]